MKKVGMILIVVSLFQYGCENEMIEGCFVRENPCGTLATVVDATGLDGCGFLLHLDDGTVLEPMPAVFICGTPPIPEEFLNNALNEFELADGQRVSIAYEPVDDMFSICMAGQMVKITCIEEVGRVARAHD